VHDRVGSSGRTPPVSRGYFFYLEIERFSGVARNATATARIGAYSCSAADAATLALLGNMNTGYLLRRERCPVWIAA
jgi:hypothetical protein